MLLFHRPRLMVKFHLILSYEINAKMQRSNDMPVFYHILITRMSGYTNNKNTLKMYTVPCEWTRGFVSSFSQVFFPPLFTCNIMQLFRVEEAPVKCRQSPTSMVIRNPVIHRHHKSPTSELIHSQFNPVHISLNPVHATFRLFWKYKLTVPMVIQMTRKSCGKTPCDCF
jgi:hypothetical protein